MNEIVIEVDGTRYTGWTEITVSKTLENLCGSFSFSSTASERMPFPVKLGRECKIFVNEILFMTGWTEKIDVDFSPNNHTISVKGRDRTNDIVDSTIGKNIEFQSKTTLKKIAEAILKELNLTHITVTDPLNLKGFDDILTDSLGVTGFKFIERFAKKRQVLLTTNGEGNIVFQRASDEKFNTVLSTEPDTVGTILEAHIGYDQTKRFNEYTVHGQTNNAGLANLLKHVPAKLNVNIQGKVLDGEIRTSRKYTFQIEDNGDSTTNTNRAAWEANFRISQSMIYQATVQGFSPLNDSGIWKINKQLRVVDKPSNINDTNSTLLITGVTFTQSVSAGSRTALTLKDRKSYTLEVSRPEKDKQDYLQGTNLIKKQEPTS